MIRPTVALGVTIFLAVVGCRSEPVDPQELLTTNAIGQSDLRKGQLQLAEEQFRKVVALAPRDPLGHANLGLTYLRGERYAAAEIALQRARRLSPDHPEVGLILAKLFSLTGRVAEARKTLEDLRPDARTLYALAELDALDTAAADRHRQRLKEVLTIAPTNLAVRLKLADLFARRGSADSALMYLEDVRRIAPEPPRDARPHLDTALRQLRAGNVAAARAPLDRFLQQIALTSPYQASLEDVKWVDGPLVGRPVMAFNPQTLITMRGIAPASRSIDVRFVDVTGEAGFPAPSAPVTALALGDYDNDGVDDVFVSGTTAGGASTVRLYRVQGGYMADVTERLRLATSLPAGAAHATFADADNDGWLDLFVIGVDGRGYLLRNDGGAAFESVGAKAGLTDLHGARKSLFLDADHDGDIDLFLVGDTTRLYRNNLDGTFTEISRAAGFGSVGATRDAAFGDFDQDGRTDLFIVRRDGGGVLFRNAGLQMFRDVTVESGIDSRGAASVAVGDFDNDGRLDIATAARGRHSIWRNSSGGRFAGGRTRDDARTETTPHAVTVLDYDNDGWLDLVAAGAGGVLLRNERNGRFRNPSLLSGAWLSSARVVVPSDVDGDGDLDLFLGDGVSGIRLLRNDGGNARMAMQVQLTGLRTGSGKNNTFGFGATIEVRAGEIYQTRVVTSRVTAFGLGPHIKADVVRVLWTNGVPETIYFPGTDEDVLELEHLKGSCAFVYTWDGKRFRFVTDVMWRSALGMPLGLMGGGGTAYAPAGASREFIRIPADALQPRNGRYVLQVTEELWETAYLDEIKLLAVDHPDSVDAFVDERFPPVTEQLRIYQASTRRIPRSATDDAGHDVLPALRARDDVYVSNLKPLQYQGLMAPHDLILDLGEAAGQRGSHLFLQGWVYPTDASINVALSQQSGVRVTMPSLEVRDARGEWRTAIANIGFPSGKDKTVVIDLEGQFPTKDHHVRIRTNMQVYWDHAFVATDAPGAVATAELRPIGADLHARGYSRMYRKGGRYGPHWFAYEDVSRESPWRPIEGAFTRFGDVRPLLASADDRYVVMAPGDETTVEFDAAALAPVRAGWKRTFLLYTDGWIKDADLNTAFGNTVEPLPFHAMREYPYAAGEAYPADPALQQYRREYNTRRITRR